MLISSLLLTLGVLTPNVAFAGGEDGLNYAINISNYTGLTVQIERSVSSSSSCIYGVEGMNKDSSGNLWIAIYPNQTNEITIETEDPCTGGSHSDQSFLVLFGDIPGSESLTGEISFQDMENLNVNHHCINYSLVSWYSSGNSQIITQSEDYGSGYYTGTVNLNICNAGDSRCLAPAMPTTTLCPNG